MISPPIAMGVAKLMTFGKFLGLNSFNELEHPKNMTETDP
jgi:hypothetical protein